MQCPLLVLECRQITRRNATESSTTSARESYPTELQLHRVVRARRVCTKGSYHGIRTPTGPRSELARLRNSARGTSLFLSISPLLDTF